MPEPPGRVTYSRRSGRFYQEGRRGALSREAATPFLEYDREADRWRDQRGGFVPEAQLGPPETKVQRFIRHDEEGRPFLQSSLTYRRIERSEAVQERLQGNQQITIRTVVTTEDGKTWVDEVSSKLGGRPDITDLEALASRKMRAKLVDEGYTVTTHDVDRLTKRRDYQRRTISVRGKK